MRKTTNGAGGFAPREVGPEGAAPKGQHTPGPWTLVEVNTDAVKGAVHVYGGGAPITMDVWGPTLATSDANARLIAAAPDLLGFVRLVAALEDKCRSEGGRHPTYAEWAVLATSIPTIARATGGDK